MVAIVPLVVDSAFAVTSSRAGDDVRQRGAEGGQEEPVDGDDDQRAGVERQAADTAQDLGGDRDHGRRPATMLATTSRTLRRHRSSSTPANGPITEYGSSTHREAGSDVRGPGLLLGVEQDRTGEAGLEDPVAELPEQPDARSRRNPAGRARCAGGVRCPACCLASCHASRAVGPGRFAGSLVEAEVDAKMCRCPRRGSAGSGLEPAAGRLLVATPVLGDPHFARTVVYLLEHDGGGTVGVILNRPSRTPVGQVLPDWHEAVTGPAGRLRRRPVQPDGALCLAQLDGGRPRRAPRRRRHRRPSTWTAT